ncbi:hypothetical protein ACSBL2_07510 [Pedobacter sp. AW31-3R]|uniref:hypothetical protein n=1 Tax=Pedobacter sp. AW31-3R TaxID=3445781 RepID=UPI003F9FD35B
MIKGTYQYALLQYHHSQLLGEILNIGLVAYFPQYKRLEFIFPEKLIRLKYAYPNVPERTIKSYFRYFQERVNTLNKTPHLFYDHDMGNGFQQFLEKEFLAPDASALQFGNYRNSVLYTPEIQKITDQLYNLYFSVFQIQDSNTEKVDESILLRKYKKFLGKFLNNDQSLNKTSNIYLDYAIRPNASASIRFDIAWKEHANTHLVKPVSFDLQRPESIQRKAWQYFGQFEDLQEFATQNGYLFDVILAKPKSKDLFKPYENAIRLLGKPNRVNLVEFDNLQSYSQHTMESILDQ